MKIDAERNENPGLGCGDPNRCGGPELSLINWDNSAKGLCVVCSSVVGKATPFVCKNCKKPCQGIEQGPRDFWNVNLFASDWKSECCAADIWVTNKNTCSESCHEVLVLELEHSFGKYKKVIDVQTDLAHRVPTRDIIEKGLVYSDLKRYPLWVDGA